MKNFKLQLKKNKQLIKKKKNQKDLLEEFTEKKYKKETGTQLADLNLFSNPKIAENSGDFTPWEKRSSFSLENSLASFKKKQETPKFL